jgi:calcineurin-like phosphoesterase family protein
MSKNAFLISDTHFGHSNILTFTKDESGELLRPGFANVDEMNEHMVDQWNKTVTPNDKVYHLGDVCMSHKLLHIIDRLNGRKILIKGNHDVFKLSQYAPYFSDIRAYSQLGKFILSHIPIHPESIGRWAEGNIHGHLHHRRVMLNKNEIDRRYICVSVEHTNYAPIAFEEIERIR